MHNNISEFSETIFYFLSLFIFETQISKPQKLFTVQVTEFTCNCITTYSN